MKLIWKSNKSVKYMIVLGILSLIYPLLVILSSGLMGILTERALHLPFSELLFLFLTAGIVFLLQVIVEYGYYAVRGSFSAGTLQNLQKKLVQTLSRCEMYKLQQCGSGEVMSRIQNELPMAVSAVCETIPDLVMNTLSMGICVAAMLFYSKQLAFVYLGMMMVILALQMILTLPIGKGAEQMQKATADANTMARDILAQRETIKGYNAQEIVQKWYQRVLGPLARTSRQLEMTAVPLRTIGWLLGIVPIYVFCIVGAVMVSKKQITFSAFMGIYYMMDVLLGSSMHFVDLFIALLKGKSAASRIRDVIGMEEREAGEKEERTRQEDGKEAPAISFQHVWFSYKEAPERAEDWVLKDLSFEIAQGEKVAFVGGSGCGKSTVMKLIEGFLHPQKGEIFRENHSYATLGESEKELSFVPQTPYVFADTLKNNIVFSDDETDLQEAYEKSCLTEVIQRLPEGERTQIGEGGNGLSLGQIQRIAVARAFARQAKLIVMDEATAALDAESDKAVTEAMLGLPSDITVIAVTHRLTYLNQFDRIYVMENGQIAESGTHELLRKQDGSYRRLLENGGDSHEK